MALQKPNNTQQMELNKIYNESNLVTMSKMKDNFIDLTVTSPPYDDLRNYNGYSFEFEKVAKELFRVTKEGGVVVWNVGDSTTNGSESLTSFKQALYFVEECGFRLHDTMIYAKNNYVPLTHNRYEQQFEYMFVFSKGKPKTFNPIMIKSKYAGTTNKPTFRQDADAELRQANTPKPISDMKIKPNIWFYDVGKNKSSNDELAFKHPATFPEKLCKEHIYSWTNENDIVYDCFIGSGTTAKMANYLKRNWIGSEISKEYTDLANNRLKPYLTQHVLF